MAEGIFPKTSGEIFYAADANLIPLNVTVRDLVGSAVLTGSTDSTWADLYSVNISGGDFKQYCRIKFEGSTQKQIVSGERSYSNLRLNVSGATIKTWIGSAVSNANLAFGLLKGDISADIIFRSGTDIDLTALNNVAIQWSRDEEGGNTTKTTAKIDYFEISGQ